MPGAHPTFDVPTDPAVIDEINTQIEKLQQISIISPNNIHDLLGDHKQCNISFYSRQFHPFGDSLGASYHFVGPLLPQADDIYAGERAGIYISLGSIYGIKQDIFYQNCLKAFGHGGEQVYLSLANHKSASFDLGNIPDNVELLQEFNQERQLSILAKCRTFVTHGGMNSIQEAISRETPMVIFPIGLNQGFMGDHVESMNCGVKLQEGSHSASALAEAADLVANSQDIQEGLVKHHDFIRQSGGGAAASRIIKSLALAE